MTAKELKEFREWVIKARNYAAKVTRFVESKSAMADVERAEKIIATIDQMEADDESSLGVIK